MNTTPVEIDIVSDVVCPWCIVGYKQLEIALAQLNMQAIIHWQPFELNPQMPEEGQNLQEHITEKYGMSPEQSLENRARLTELGESLNFTFNYNGESRMVNTFKAHQLLHLAGLSGKEHALKLELFSAYFSDQRDINDNAVLLECAVNSGLDKTTIIEALEAGNYESAVREQQATWIKRGVQGVPAMVFSEKYLVTGAQGVENYTQILQQLSAESEAK